jgi:Ca2+-binding RTX toxin-like protein
MATEGNDELSGDIGGVITNDTIDGLAGDDQISGLAGNDSLIGGEGQDTIDGGTGNDTIDGGVDGDFLYGRDGHDSIDGGAGGDFIEGGAGNDTIDGGTGDNIIAGGAGNDTIDGGADGDVIFGGDRDALGNSIDVGSGNDTIYGRGGDDTIYAGDGTDTIDGGDGVDGIDGGAGNDTIDGGADNDSVDAGGGNDTITGGQGADKLIGGAGSDVFTYVDAAESTSDVTAMDTILDFEGVVEERSPAHQDKIDLVGLLGNVDLTWGGTTATPKGVWYAHGTEPVDPDFPAVTRDVTFVYADVSDDTTPELVIKLIGRHELREADFLGVNTNRAPTANNDTRTATEDLTLAAASVLGNDTDPDVEDLDVAAVKVGTSTIIDGGTGDLDGLANGSIQFATTAGGTATIDLEAGTFSYEQNGVFNGLDTTETGADSFQYQATDGTDPSGFATVDITVNGVNDAPTANNDTRTATEDLTLAAASVLGNDTDPDVEDLDVAAVKVGTSTIIDGGTGDLDGLANGSIQFATTAGGTATIDLEAGTFSYEQNGVFNGLDTTETGADSFQYQATDGTDPSGFATVDITVNGVNDAPTARADVLYVSNNTVVTLPGRVLFANDTDPDGDTLSLATLVRQSGSFGDLNADGVVNAADIRINPDGSFTFKTGASGGSVSCPTEAALTYTASDGNGGTTGPATVTLKIVNTTADPDTVNLTGVVADGSYIDGKSFNDKITGSQHVNDYLLGGSGNDVLRGLQGNDTLVGGAGNDTFVFNTATNALTNVDTLVEFNAGGNISPTVDKIALDPVVFAALAAGTAAVDSGEFRASAGGDAADANDFILYDTTTGSLFYDADGNTTGGVEKVLFAKVTGLTGTLDHTDFTTVVPPGP